MLLAQSDYTINMKEQRKPLKPLTIKQAKLVKAIASGQGRRDAVLDIYNVARPETASVVAHETLNKPNVKFALEKALEKNGLTLDTVFKPVADALSAVKETNSGDSVPDHTVRLNAVKIAAGFMGITANNQDGDVNFVTFTMNQKNTYQI